MEIHLEEHTVREVCNSFVDNDEQGVYGFGGKLNIRPKYQREFVYNDDQQKAVIHTVMHGFPLNVMYWVKNGDDSYELLDGQQRTMSLCKYVTNKFSVKIGENPYCFDNLTKSEQERILDYKLLIYICEGDDKERLEWFKTINIAGLKLTDQELRNACYTGEWLTSAKERFSKSGCTGQKVSDKLVKAEVNRQGLLEVALKWISHRDNLKQVEEYMASHQHDKNADELWTYFRQVCDWVDMKFKKKRKEMINQPWNEFYEDFKDKSLDADELEEEISRLMQDNEVQRKSGIYPYVLYRDQRHLNLRAFDDDVKRETYERQGGICPMCEKEGNAKTHYELSEMQADHINPWSKGGKTTPDNCMMLCRRHNAMKSDH